MKTRTATVVIDRAPDEVWRAIADVTRMGEWSPGRVFEFVAEGMTTWRYELQPEGTGTRVTVLEAGG